MFFLRKRFWLTVLKVVALVYVAGLMLLQVPELRYDLGRQRPVPIETPEDLRRGNFGHSTFVRVAGTPDFSHSFRYSRYGLYFTYFNVEEFGMRLLVKTFDRPNEDWRHLDHFLGRLSSFERHHFSRRISSVYQEEFGVSVPRGAYVLALDDVPELSGWQVGGMALMGVLWVVMFYFFFLWRRSKRPKEDGGASEGG